jgi:hypothetical protein
MGSFVVSDLLPFEIGKKISLPHVSKKFFNHQEIQKA